VSPKTFTAYKIPPKEEQEEGECNRRLKEYVEKLRNAPFQVSFEKVKEAGYSSPKDGNNGDPEHHKARYYGGGFTGEHYEFVYEPIPEEVACFALEKLDEVQHGLYDHIHFIKWLGGEEWRVNIEYTSSRLSIIIYSKTSWKWIELNHHFYENDLWDDPDVNVDWR